MNCANFHKPTISRIPMIWSGALIVLIAFALTAGCENKPTQPDDAPQVLAETPDPLTVLVIGEPDLGSRVKRQWSARRDGGMTIQNQTVAEFESNDFIVPDGVDVVIYPPTLMGELVAREQLRQLPNDFLDSDEYNKHELLRHFRTSVVYQRDDAWAAPLGGPNFSLLCNRDAFESVRPVELWEDMDRTLTKLAKSDFVAANDRVEAKVDMPLSPGWAVHTFLARVAPAIVYNGKLSTVLDRSTMKPLVTGPPFVEALEQLKQIASSRSLELDPHAVFELAITGQSAIAIGWPAMGFQIKIENDKADKADNAAAAENSDQDGNNRGQDRLTIRPLPGMPMWFDESSNAWIKRTREEDMRVDTVGFSGLVASVSSKSSNSRWAWNFLRWLPEKSISKLVLVDSPLVGPFRASHLGDAGRWTGDMISMDVADEYADVILENHDRALVLMVPRIPGYRQYMDALDKAVRAAIAGEVEPKAALDGVAKTWDEITESYGRQTQIREMRRESGL